MKMVEHIVFQCPYCKAGIDQGGHCWSCVACGRQFPVRLGVPFMDFGEKGARGFIWAREPEAFLARVEKEGWRNALGSVQKPNGPSKLQEAIAPNRVSWSCLFDMDSSWKVLDIGAGTGGVACQLARDCFSVGLDKSWYDAVFMELRAKQDNLSKFQAVVADALGIPFDSSQFDLAVMIGSFEWIPTGWPTDNPKEVQLQALKEVRRILKPGGHFFLGIENRYYLGYFIGIPEPHTDLKYISLMDGHHADALSRDLRGKPYLELTHSKDGYVELLKEAGFEQIQAFWLYPNYRLPNYIIPLDHVNGVQSFVETHLDPRDFGGKEMLLYPFYRFLDPKVILNCVRDFGFVACRPNDG
jgi:SAM-dependent methyltransferase